MGATRRTWSSSLWTRGTLPVKETAEIETEMAENSSWGQANLWQKLGLVWRNRKKSSQIINESFTYRSSSLLFYGVRVRGCTWKKL